MCLPPDCLLVQGDEDRPDGRLCRCTWNFAFAAWGRPELLERRIDWHLLVGHGTRHRTPTALRWRPRARQAGPGTAGRAPRQRALLIGQQSHPLCLMERSTRGARRNGTRAAGGTLPRSGRGDGDVHSLLRRQYRRGPDLRAALVVVEHRDGPALARAPRPGAARVASDPRLPEPPYHEVGDYTAIATMPYLRRDDPLDAVRSWRRARHRADRRRHHGSHRP